MKQMPSGHPDRDDKQGQPSARCLLMEVGETGKMLPTDAAGDDALRFGEEIEKPNGEG